MTGPGRDSARGQLQVLLDAGAVGQLRDGPLLERFLTGASDADAAFTELVERHGPMVRRLCGRILRNPHDAEDAAQAAFLVLARRARAIRHRDSVGSWLFGVAYRLSVRLRGSTIKRRIHERRSAKMNASASDQADDATAWKELYTELERLPDRYRVPLVLCYLEGLTNDEAAARLQWPLRTVQRRLSEGRGRLRARLIRHGLGLSVGLLAAGTNTRAEELPRPWLAATVRAATSFASGRSAAGPASTRAIQLAERMVQSMLRAQLLVVPATIFVLSVIIAAIPLAEARRTTPAGKAGSASPPRQGPANASPLAVAFPPKPRDTPAEPRKSTDSDLKTFDAAVVDAKTGKPIPNATIRYYTDPGESQFNSGGDGHISLPRPTRDRYAIVIDVWADGYQQKRFWYETASTSKKVGPLPASVSFGLEPGAFTVSGRILDEGGKAVENAQVRLGGVRAGEYALAFFGITISTDRDGRWSSRSTPETLSSLSASINHPDFEPAYLDREPAAEIVKKARAGTLVTKLKRGVRVQGHVRDEAGKPIRDAKITQPNPAGLGISAYPEAATNAEGAFVLPAAIPTPETAARFPGGTRNLLIVAPGYQPVLEVLDLKKGSRDPIDLDFRLKPGKTIKLRAVDQFGAPVAGAWVIGRQWQTIAWEQILGVTDADGRFEFNGAPEGAFTLDLSARGYQGEPKTVTADDPEQTWQLEHTLSVELRINDAQSGKPVKRFELVQGRVDVEGKVAWGAAAGQPQGNNRGIRVHLFGRAHKSLTTDAPAWRLRVVAQGYRSLETREIKKDEGQVRLDLKLERLGFGEGGGPAGLVLDSQGNPVEEAEVMLATHAEPASLNSGGSWWHGDATLSWSGAGTVLTDAEGHFTFLPTKGPFTLGAAHPEKGYAEIDDTGLANDGHITLKPWGRIQGRVEENGKPVASAKVRLSRPSVGPGSSLTIGVFEEAVTDAEGRFAIERVPSGLFSISSRVGEVAHSETDVAIAPGKTVEVTLEKK